jgi:hypothetical protein
MSRAIVHCTIPAKEETPDGGTRGFFGFVWGNSDREGCLSRADLTTSALPVNRAFCHGLCGFNVEHDVLGKGSFSHRFFLLGRSRDLVVT